LARKHSLGVQMGNIAILKNRPFRNTWANVLSPVIVIALSLLFIGGAASVGFSEETAKGAAGTVSKGVEDTGKTLEKVGQDTGKTLERAGQDTSKAIEKAAHDTGDAILARLLGMLKRLAIWAVFGLIAIVVIGVLIGFGLVNLLSRIFTTRPPTV
jgi:hypothetical protein